MINVTPLLIKSAFILILNIPNDVDVIALQKQVNQFTIRFPLHVFQVQHDFYDLT